MTTNANGHTVWNLTNRVMAVIDDAAKAQAAVDTLERAGVPEHELAALSGTEGIREIDVEGIHGGGVRQAVRALQRVTTEGDHLRHDEAELAQGHLVAYGPWTIESVAA